jgi:phosphate transport system protein
MESHIDRHFDEALEGLKQQIRLMALKVESMVADSIRALAQQEEALARQVFERDHPVNALEVSVDEQCLELLARYQPAAGDLRFITRGLKIATDLERVGDLAVNTSERVLDIIRSKQGSPPIDLTAMVQVVQTMLKDSIDAFVTGNEALANSVLERDDVVDDLTESHVMNLIERLANEPQRVGNLFPLSSIVRYLERIADHSTNIAEQAIFMIRGLDVRHGKPH